jgi:hypothetical protein
MHSREIEAFWSGLGFCDLHHSVGQWATHHIAYCFADPAHAAAFRERLGEEPIEPTAEASKEFMSKPAQVCINVGIGESRA